MSYLSYLQEKLHAVEVTELIDHAIKYLGTDYPTSHLNKKRYEIVDEWIDKIMVKWNIEFRTLNFSKASFLGKLEPKNRGFIINLNKNLHTTQRRLTIAHEIAHILSYNTSSNWPTYEVAHSLNEEIYCDRIARALLLPKSLIDFKKFNLANVDKEQVDLIKQLWQEFRVSPWQIIRRIFDETNNSCLIGILWEHDQQESCLRILDYHHQRNAFIPKNDRVYLSSLMAKPKTNFSPVIAFESNELFQGDDLIAIGSLYKKVAFSTTFPIKTSFASYIIQIIKS